MRPIQTPDSPPIMYSRDKEQAWRDAALLLYSAYVHVIHAGSMGPCPPELLWAMESTAEKAKSLINPGASNGQRNTTDTPNTPVAQPAAGGQGTKNPRVGLFTGGLP